MTYLLKNSPHNEEYITHACTENANELAAIALESVRQRGIVDDETTLQATVDNDLKTVTVTYDHDDQTQFYIVTIPNTQNNHINQLLEIASLILYKFTENKETWTEYDTLAHALENTPTTNPQLQIKINTRTQEFRQRQITERTTHYERTQRDSQINSQRD